MSVRGVDLLGVCRVSIGEASLDNHPFAAALACRWEVHLLEVPASDTTITKLAK